VRLLDGDAQMGRIVSRSVEMEFLLRLNHVMLASWMDVLQIVYRLFLITPVFLVPHQFAPLTPT